MSSPTKPGEVPTDLPAIYRGYPNAVRNLILSAAAVATTVLLGWALHCEPMKRIATGLTSMNPMTATCFEAASLALWTLRMGPAHGRRQWLTVLPALFIIFVGGSKLWDLATGSTICPDALLFPSQLDFGQQYPSRMAPNVAASFIMMGIALLTMDRPRWPAFLHPQWLVTPILGAALAALIGYAYDTTGFYKYRQFIPMALHSAVCFMLLSTALIFSRADQGFIRLIPRDSHGARSYARMLPACILIPAALGGIELYGVDHGWFSGRGMGTSIVSVLTIVALSILAFLNAVALSRTEAVRKQSNAALQNMVRELDTSNQALQAEIIERKRQQEIALHEATHDPLTGLPNRLLFVDRLQQAIGRTVRHDIACALFYIDIDRFKPVNDAYGHLAGDLLLRQIAQRLVDSVRDVDTVARLGGDEFAVIMESPTHVDAALMLARRIGETVTAYHSLALPEQHKPIEVHIGISIGVAVFPGHGTDLDSLVRTADSAMYRAKTHGRNLGKVASIELARACA